MNDNGTSAPRVPDSFHEYFLEYMEAIGMSDAGERVTAAMNLAFLGGAIAYNSMIHGTSEGESRTLEQCIERIGHAVSSVAEEAKRTDDLVATMKGAPRASTPREYH